MSATLPLSSIRCDGGTQPRENIDNAVVAEYAERLLDGDVFPPVTVFYDGSDHWLADGFHRMAAHDEANQDRIAVDIQQGTRRDAVLHSAGANGGHGIRRSNEDKRRAVTTLLNDAEWGAWSDREIARRCRVSHATVATVRAETGGHTGQIASIPRTYVHPKTGEPTKMNVGGIQDAAKERAERKLSKTEESRRKREAEFGADYTAAFPETPDAPPTPPRAVVQHVPYSARMKALIAAAVEASAATDQEVAAIPANDMMIQSLRNARDVLDRIITHHSKGRQHG